MSDTIDLTSLLELREMQAPDKPDVVARLVARFLAEMPARLTTLRSAAETGNAQELERAAHALKGIAGTMGASEMHNLAAKLERLGRAGHTDGALELVSALEQAHARAIPVFEGLTRTVPPEPA